MIIQDTVLSTHVDEFGMLRLLYSDSRKLYLITYTPSNKGFEDEVLIYTDEDKERSGMKFYKLCTGSE